MLDLTVKHVSQAVEWHARLECHNHFSLNVPGSVLFFGVLWLLLVPFIE